MDLIPLMPSKYLKSFCLSTSGSIFLRLEMKSFRSSFSFSSCLSFSLNSENRLSGFTGLKTLTLFTILKLMIPFPISFSRRW